MTPWVLAVTILLSPFLFFALANRFPRVRSLLLAIGFYMVLTGIFAAYSNWLPQIEGMPPAINPRVDRVSVYTMPSDKLADLGEAIIFGKVGGYAERGIGKGQCPLCHTFKPDEVGDRAPNLLGEVKRAEERIREPRYLHPNTVQLEAFPGSGRATTADEYIAESHVCPSCYVAPGYGVKGTDDRESPMAADNKPPISLTMEEMIAVHTWLYVHDGLTPPTPQQILADHEKFIPESERRYSGPNGTVRTSRGDIIPPPVPGGPPIALASDTPEQIITKMGCFACHQIPGISSARFGVIGPVLILRTTAPKRLASSKYQARVAERQAHAKTPREYVIESIVKPSAFVVPGFIPKSNPSISPMIQDYGQKFTYDALDKIAEYLLTLDCDSARKDGLTGPPQEPVGKVCGN